MARNPLIEALGFEPARGQLTLHDARYLLVRPETLAAIQHGMERAAGAAARRVLYDAGRTGGALSAGRFREAFPERPASDLVRFMCDLGTDAGWGRFNVRELEPDSHFTVQVTNGPLCAAYGRSPEPVCHLLCGVMAGVGAVLLGAEPVALETACGAVAEGACEFTIRAPGAPVPFRSRPG